MGGPDDLLNLNPESAGWRSVYDLTQNGVDVGLTVGPAGSPTTLCGKIRTHPAV